MDDVGFLWFEDFFDHDYSADDWLTVTQWEKQGHDLGDNRKQGQSICSVLIPNVEEQIKIVNDKQTWITNWAQLHHISEVESEKSRDEEKYYLESYGVQFKQFLCYEDYSESEITVRPDFIKKYNLIKKEKGKTWVDSENNPVVRFSDPNKIEIKTKSKCLPILNY